LAFYLVHAATQGKKAEGTRAATLAGIALTTLFGAVRDYTECGRCVIVIGNAVSATTVDFERFTSIKEARQAIQNLK
jgi:hypothetical protein